LLRPLVDIPRANDESGRAERGKWAGDRRSSAVDDGWHSVFSRIPEGEVLTRLSAKMTVEFLEQNKVASFGDVGLGAADCVGCHQS